MNVQQLGHLRLQFLHSFCSQRVVFKWRMSFVSTRFTSISCRSVNLNPCPHTQQSYMRFGVNIVVVVIIIIIIITMKIYIRQAHAEICVFLCRCCSLL
jgi:hypothetical protein